MSGARLGAGMSRRRRTWRSVASMCTSLLAAALIATPPAAAAGATVVSLTFHDANTSQYTYARPVLAAHGVAATFYVPTGWVDAGTTTANRTDAIRPTARHRRTSPKSPPQVAATVADDRPRRGHRASRQARKLRESLTRR